MSQEYDVNIDYLTITSPNTADIAGFVAAFQRSIPMEGGGRPFRWMGYEGEVYVADEGHLAWGVKSGHGLCQMSGLWSDRVFRNLDEFRLMEYRCTRIDLAVTVALPSPSQLVKDAISNRQLNKGNWTAITKTNGEGGTLYVGCRKSDMFGRLYDKGAEIRSRLNKSTIPDAVLWRYEVEYKRAKAEAVRDRLACYVRVGLGLSDTIASIVHAWFYERQINPFFSSMNRDGSIVSVASRVTSLQKTLDWMRVQVRPAIQRCSSQVETSAILQALGVDVDGIATIRADRPKLTAFQRNLWDGLPADEIPF